MPDVITGPGWYKTRRGKRVEIIAKGRGECWIGYQDGDADDDVAAWHANGSYFDYCPSDDDLIAPWTDPEETRCVAIYSIDGRLIPAIIEPDDSPVSGEVGRAVVKLKGGA